MNETAQFKPQNSGSLWHRWEPHVHAPGTLLNNQFKGDNPWEDYLEALEQSDPPIRVLAVTDYYLMDTYKRVVEAKTAGRLDQIDLIFPNIELRLDKGTNKGRWVNIHLLIRPDDDDHVAKANRLLKALTFRAYDEVFACTPDDLTSLGKAADPKIIDDGAALRHGAEQFKVGFDQLREEYEKSAWARKNILIAVAGGETDGTSGVRDGADVTLRREMEKFADVIFASSQAQRDFWLGRKANISKDELVEQYGGLKPCLHGSDAHGNGTVGLPDGKRYSWIKGGLEFDALRQACIDPEGRAFVGEEPPSTGTPSQLIDTVEVINADWAKTPKIALNPGLVAIIGARGSGKTALADMIAMGCDGIGAAQGDGSRPSSSFLSRAEELLGNAQIITKWLVGDETARALDGSTTPDVSYPRARYLSQQFVEDLCSSQGLNDGLLSEIERVIFEAHPLLDRDGALNFSELLDQRAQRYRQARRREEEAIAQLSERIGTELEKSRTISSLQSDITKKLGHITAYTTDRSKLVAKGSEERVARLNAVMAAANTVRGFLRYYGKQEQALLALKDEVTSLRQNEAPEMLRRSQERHADSRLKDEEWAPFKIDYTGDVDDQIDRHLGLCRSASKKWRGSEVAQLENAEIVLIKDDADLERQTLGLLEAETTRLQNLVNADINTQNRFKALSDKITEETAALTVLQDRLKDAKGAKDRANALQKDREDAYQRVFGAISSEQCVLVDLYAPLMERLAGTSGSLEKMSFRVTRKVEIAAWAGQAEDNLVDLRRAGPFKGQGKLLEYAEEVLLQAWRTGNAEATKTAMTEFRTKYMGDLLKHATVSRAEKADYRQWLKHFAKWLYSTDHITLEYGIEYDGVDIRKLSPGTRGIVLLLLYLALDDADDRPLIIDQPEENLDPKSVYDELVDLFISAKTKRQVIMVTHNANLVINTDADQIIIAEADNHVTGELPHITYTSGGLENETIRKSVCDILEGGEHAFKERARRLRVKFPK